MDNLIGQFITALNSNPSATRRSKAASLLGGFEHLYSDSRIVPALIEALDDPSEMVRNSIARALNEILEKSYTYDKISKFERNLVGSYEKFARKHGKKDRIRQIEENILKIWLAASQKKNQLAPKRDILLTDIPKPPKRGSVYQTIRRARNG